MSSILEAKNLLDFVPFETDPNKIPTLDDFFYKTFLVDKEKLAVTTRRNYTQTYEGHLHEDLGSDKLNEIDHGDVQRIINHCPTYYSAIHSKQLLQDILQYSMDAYHLLPYNVADYKKFTYPEQEIPRYYGRTVVLKTFQDIRQLILFIHKRIPGSPIDRATILILGFGLRPGEGFGANNRDIDMMRRQLHIIHSNSAFAKAVQFKGPKKPVSMRILPIYPFIYELLEDIEFIGGPDDPFVVNQYGRRCDSGHMSEQLKRFRRRNGLPEITFESMRHSFATTCARGGMDPKSLGRWMGHASMSTTMTDYVNVDFDDLIADGDVISAYLSDPNKPQNGWDAQHQPLLHLFE